MQIDKDPEVFKLLVSIIAFFAGILNVFGIIYLKILKSNDKELYEKTNKNRNDITEIKATCKERHLYLGEERRKNKK